MKIGLLGNCQIESYMKLLKVLFPNSEVVLFPIHILKKTEYLKAFKSLKKCDLVLSQPLSSKYECLATNSLKKKFTHLTVIHNLFFRGLHPDFTYLPNRQQSPLGDYNSKLIHDCFKKRRTEQECLDQWETAQISNHDVNRKIWNESFLDLLAREMLVSVPFALEIEYLSKEYPTFHTFNHPVLQTIYYYLKKILLHLEIDFSNIDPDTVEDPLLKNTSLPISSSVCHANNLKYLSRNHIKQPQQLGGKVLTPSQFINLSYKSYQS